jgi:peptidoglycan/xylan/chitin deacetylase (PgdA/CDA1 family)
MISKLIFALLRFTLIPFFIREVIQRRKVTIIVYHDIKPDTADTHFKILKSKYNIIALKDYVKAKKLGKVDKLPNKSLIITFDDGYKDNYRLKPLFEKYNIPATIFLCSGIVGTKRHFWFRCGISNNKREHLKKKSNKKRLEVLKKYGFEEQKEYDDRQALSKNEIEKMKKVVDFQSHTVFHPVLTKCSTEKARKECSESKKDLEHNYGLRIYALSYPNGNYSDREISIAKEVGYECGVTVDVGFNSQSTDLFRLKRMCVRDDADINELLVKASGLWWYIRKILRQVHGYVNININKLVIIPFYFFIL